MFSSKRFIVLALTLGSMIHLELIFMCHIGKGFNFVLLHVNILLLQYHLLKKLFFPHWMNLATLFKNQLTINIRIYFWILNSVPSFQVSLMPVLHWLDYFSIVVRFWNWKVWVLQLCSCLSRLFWLCRVPCISTWLSGLWHWVLWITSLPLAWRRFSICPSVS